MKNFEKNIQKYAELLVKTALNVQPGQRVLINTHIEHVDIVRAVTREAYKAGALHVNILWGDSETARIRFEEAPDASFDYSPQWLADAYNDIAEKGDCLIGFTGGDPDLLAGIDPALIQRTHIASESKNKVFRKIQKSHGMSWCVAAAPTAKWAAKVFPDVPENEQIEKMWDAIFTACRVYADDPIAAWQAHNVQLQKRAAYMNAKQYATLHYTSSAGTDLTLGLPKGHIWESGAARTTAGLEYIANVPTEEIFTLPHREQADGVVYATKPLNHAGSVIDEFFITFEKGQIKEVKAKQGQVVLESVINTDEGARRLGEVALVPHGSAISQSGILFFNTLFDENASCHLAIGSAYNFTLEGGNDMDDEEFNSAGGNTSLTHVDFMIGSGDLNIDGILVDGSKEPIMRNGEWAFEV